MIPPSFLGSIYTYPWDLRDEGIDRALDRIHDTGCREVMLAASYHVSTYFLPHNPRRPIYWGEDGALYFQPNWARFKQAGIRPMVSSVVEGNGYMERMADSVRRRGLEFSAWLVYFYNHHLAENNPSLTRHDAFGNPYLGQLSCGPEQMHEYAAALTADVLEKFNPAAVHVESLHRMRWDYGFRNPKVLSPISPQCQFLLGVDFNPRMRAQWRGESDRLMRDVRDWLRPRLERLPTAEDQAPAAGEWIERAFEGRLKSYLEICQKRTTALWQTVSDMIHKAGARVQSGMAGPDNVWRTDLAVSSNIHLDRVTVSPGIPSPEVDRIQRQIRERGAVLVSTQPGTMTEAGPLINQVRSAKEAGCGGCTFYNYGLLREQQLGFIAEALRSV